MAILKIICNLSSKLYVDQEFVSELNADKLFKMELASGAYLVDVVSKIDDEILVTFDLYFDNDNQQVLKRIDLAEQERKSKKYELKSEIMRKSNMVFDDMEVIKEYVNTPYDFYPIDGFYKIKKNDKIGLLDNTGKLVLDIKYDEIETQWWQCYITGFFAKNNQKCGYYTPSGEEVIACDYDSIEPFEELPDFTSIFVVTKNGKKALYVDGFVTDFIYDSITAKYVSICCFYNQRYKEEHYSSNPNCVFLVSLDDRNFCILGINGELLLKDIYDSIDIDGYEAIDDKIDFLVKKDGKEFWASGRLR